VRVITGRWPQQGATGSRGYMGAIGATGADVVQVKVHISKRRVARQAAGCPGLVLALIFLG